MNMFTVCVHLSKLDFHRSCTVMDVGDFCKFCTLMSSSIFFFSLSEVLTQPTIVTGKGNPRLPLEAPAC